MMTPSDRDPPSGAAPSTPDPVAQTGPGEALARGFPPEVVRMMALVAAIAMVLRVLHNESMLADPLYFNPLGGHLPLLIAAEDIARGDWVPWSGPISLNSPLYPYLLAGLYKVVGIDAFHAVRTVTAALDAGTCALVSLLAFRRFGTVAGWAAGLTLAVYGPAIFFATDLVPVPFTLFFLTLSLVLLDGVGSVRRFLLAGLLFALAVDTRPNVLLGAPLLLLVPWVRRLPRRTVLSAALAGGLAIGLAPVTLLNLASSGEPVLLTVSGGHNLYIGHNPEAQAQYRLPAALDGDIFESMKGLAERTEGRPMADTEVSGWYFRRALAHILQAPRQELGLLGRRALLLVNDFEATTYSNYEYQRAYSPVLRVAPTFLVLFLLAAPGSLLALRRDRFHLWIPFLTSAMTVLIFFYIARLRVVGVPSLAVFAGAAVQEAVRLWRTRAWRPLATGGAIAVVAAVVAGLPLLHSDPSNEWNKAGGILRSRGYYERAETALNNARQANPDNPDTYRNLAVLYREIGRAAEAAEAEARASALLEQGDPEAAAFERALGGR